MEPIWKEEVVTIPKSEIEDVFTSIGTFAIDQVIVLLTTRDFDSQDDLLEAVYELREGFKKDD